MGLGEGEVELAGIQDRHLEAVYDISGLTLVTRAGPLVIGGPAIVVTPFPPSTLQLSWPSQYSDFLLQSTTNLAAPNWLQFGSAGTNSIFIVVDPSEQQRFFRLKSP